MEQVQSLTEQLASYEADFRRRAAPEHLAVIEGVTAHLKATGIEKRAKRKGDAAPDAALPNALGNPVWLSDLWKKGPLVVTFYRGGWCPYCNLELHAWQQRLGDLRRLGSSLVATSPQTPDNSMSTAEENKLAYPVLSDSNLEAAHGFNIAFTLHPELIDLYSSVGDNLPVLNGNGQWVLPVPATFVIDQEGRLRFSHIDADFRERADPADVITVIESIRH